MKIFLSRKNEKRSSYNEKRSRTDGKRSCYYEKRKRSKEFIISLLREKDLVNTRKISRYYVSIISLLRERTVLLLIILLLREKDLVITRKVFVIIKYIVGII